MKRILYIGIPVSALVVLAGILLWSPHEVRESARKSSAATATEPLIETSSTPVNAPKPLAIPEEIALDQNELLYSDSRAEQSVAVCDEEVRDRKTVESKLSEAPSPAALFGSRAGGGYVKSRTPPPVSTPVPAAKGLAVRDLGDGAGGEKLGDRVMPGEVVAMEPTGEGYAPLTDNAFIRTGSRGGDASTFGLDVDTASYSNVRRLLLAGQRPPADAVRIEEMLNSFVYAYPTPSGEHPLAATATMSECPWAPGHRLLRVAVSARTVDRAARPPVSAVFLVDVSGSMDDPNKLPLVVETLERFAAGLDERDRVAIVTYAGADRVVLESTAGNHQDAIRAALRNLKAGGGTNGAGGIRRAYAEAARDRVPGSVGRVVLCTDGDFNIGESDPERLKALIAEQAASGTFLNVFGFGTGNYQDATAEALADRGNGVYAYIDSVEQARRTVEEDLMGQLVTVAKDAKVQVFFNPARVTAWRQIGYENRRLNRQDFNDDRKDAGDVGAGHQVTVLYELIPIGSAPSDANPFVKTEQVVPGEGPALRLRLRYKQPSAATSRLVEQDVPDTVTAMDGDLRFAAAVAGFGMLLRGSPHRGGCTWEMVANLARSGDDDRRNEFRELVSRAAQQVR